MEYKKHSALSLFRAFVFAMITIGAVAVASAQDKVDPSGTWTWSNPGRGDRPATTNTLVLKYSGSALTGTVTSPKRGGGTASVDIADGKLAGSEISFNVIREFGGNSVTIAYSGTVTADTITGNTTMERDGEKHSRKWVAKKSAASAQ
jgi:hypothetical protein